jgi:hypothetical protein
MKEQHGVIKGLIDVLFDSSLMDNGNYWNHIFTAPWCRVSSYCVGILLAFTMFIRIRLKLDMVCIYCKKNISNSNWINTLNEIYLKIRWWFLVGSCCSNITFLCNVLQIIVYLFVLLYFSHCITMFIRIRLKLDMVCIYCKYFKVVIYKFSQGSVLTQFREQMLVLTKKRNQMMVFSGFVLLEHYFSV